MWDQHRPVLSAGGGGPQTSLVAGVFHFDDAGADPFCCSLPPVVHLEKNDAGEAVLLEHIVGLIDHELTAGRPGMRGIVNRLVEILFLQAVRVPLAETCGESGGSIGGMLHPDLGTVLTLMHHQPERPWTVAELAEQAAMSRSAFSATFVRVLGKPPLQYLRQRRMQLACRLLRNPRIGLREIAARVGYDSASAFSTAFKRFSGMAPGDYRRRETHSKRPQRSLPLRPAESPCRSPE